MRRVMLLTKANREALPALYAQDGKGMEATAYVKLFDPTGRFTLYVTEFDGEDTLFGFIRSPLGADCDELGYSSLSELESVRGAFGLPLERDLYFEPQSLKSAIENRA